MVNTPGQAMAVAVLCARQEGGRSGMLAYVGKGPWGCEGRPLGKEERLRPSEQHLQRLTVCVGEGCRGGSRWWGRLWRELNL